MGKFLGIIICKGNKTVQIIKADQLLHPLEARAIRAGTLKSKLSHCRSFVKYLKSIDYQITGERFAPQYDVIWQYATYLIDEDRRAQSVTNYVSTILNSLTLSNRLPRPNSEVRERGMYLITMAAQRQPATKATPFGARFWAKLLRKANPHDARKFRQWALLGWRRQQFSRIESAEITQDGISIRTPPGKGKHQNLPATSIPCRCGMYAPSYKLTQPGNFCCAACSTPLPTWETNVTLADIEAEGYGGHSFRRTLAICVKLCLLEYNITRTEQLAQRMEWMRHRRRRLDGLPREYSLRML